MKRHFLFDPGSGTEGASGSATKTGTPVENQLVGQASDDAVKDWKEQYNNKVYALQVDGHIAYFRNPTRQHMNAAMSRASADAALDMYEMLAKLTFIGGSNEVLTDDDMFYGITQQLKVKMDGKKAVLVNL